MQLVEITSKMVWEAVIGGALLGFSGIILYIFNARPIGVSGIFNFFVAGGGDVRKGAALYFFSLVAAGTIIYYLYAPVQTLNVSAADWKMVVSGALVGVGTILGAGCTSGHGICGLGRLSIRSLAAVLTFIASGAITVFFVGY
jgi:uncharacterized protein